MPEYVVSDHTYMSKFTLFLFVGCVCYIRRFSYLLEFLMLFGIFIYCRLHLSSTLKFKQLATWNENENLYVHFA